MNKDNYYVDSQMLKRNTRIKYKLQYAIRLLYKDSLYHNYYSIINILFTKIINMIIRV